MSHPCGLTAVFTGPPCCLGFHENPGSAAPVQLLLERSSGRSRLPVLAYHVLKGRTHCSISLQPHSFQSGGSAGVGQVPAMHVPVVGHILQAKAVGTERIFEALGHLRTLLIEIPFTK
jgi:hypothetical protein